MPDVHLERNLGLLVIATEVTFPYEQPEHEASFERIDRRSPDGMFHVLHIRETGPRFLLFHRYVKRGTLMTYDTIAKRCDIHLTTSWLLPSLRPASMR